MKKDKLSANEKPEEKKNILLMALKKHKISLAIVLFFTFASFTFAWFIYNKTVDTSLTAHVKTWHIELGGEEGDTLTFALSDLYPGMDDATDTVSITNTGEMDATLSLEFESLTLFGEEQVKGTDYTVVYNATTRTYTIEGYPFHLSFSLGATELAANGTTLPNGLQFLLTWDYDHDDCAVNANGINVCDIQDTELGEKSYLYHSGDGTSAHPAHPSSEYPSLEIKVKLDMTEKTP